MTAVFPQFTPRICWPPVTKNLTSENPLATGFIPLFHSSLFGRHSNPVIVDSPSHSNFGATLPCSSSSLCLDDVRLCLESGLQVQPGKKLCSLSNKPYKAKSAGARRHSVPGTPTRGKNGVGMDVKSATSNLMTRLWSLEQLVKEKVFPSRYVRYSLLVLLCLCLKWTR